jgi:hypothetical protein
MSESHPPVPVHIPGTNKGEELVIRKGHEPGRAERGKRGYRTSRDATSINAQDRAPIDPRMPHLPPG